MTNPRNSADDGLEPVVARVPSDETTEVRRLVTSLGWRFPATLSVLMVFAGLPTDLYLPAMPTMELALGTSHGVMAWTISAYLIGFSLGQLIWGPIGDRFGRKLPIAFGLVLFIISAMGCATATNVWMLIGWRIVQAIGACASVVLARAMVRDLFEGHRAARMLSTLMSIMAVVPLVGPLLTGQLLVFVGWRAIFWALVVIGFATLAALMALPETLPSNRRNRQRMGLAFASYGQIIRNPKLLTYAGAGGFFYIGLFAFIAGGPFAYITYYHFPAQYFGVLFALGSVGIMASNFANSKLVSRYGGLRLMVWALSVAAMSGTVVAIDALTGFGGLAGLVLPLFVFMSTTGFIIANSIAGALSGFPNQAGAASALVGAIHYGSGILGSALVGLLADGTPWPLGLMMAVSGIGAFICAKLITRDAAP
jgi:DHA1 family bicyclomycin/chloramphenicol resistance-like MFS transporter